MKKTKLEKGITLIALIITIVVLLILAVVTIGAIQESKIIAHAKNASSGYNDEKAKEESAIAGYESLIEENLPEDGKEGNNPPEEEIVWAFMDLGEEGKGIILTEDVTELDLSGDKEVKAYVAIGIDFDNEEIEYPENREIITVKYNEVGNLAIWGSVEKLILGDFAQGKIEQINIFGVKNLTILASFGDIPTRFCSEENVLETLVVGEGVENIAINAFYNCEALKSLILPSTLTSIGNNAFRNCSNLTNITIKKAEGSLDLSNSGLTEAQIASIVWAPEPEQ